MWDTKYRPRRFDDVLGQEGSVQILKARLENRTGLDTSYLFCGGHGQGKTTLARVLARALLCQQLQPGGEPCNSCDNCVGIFNGTSEAFVEQDAASHGTTEHMRAIVEDLPFVVPGAPKRIYLFDEAHRMSKEAQDVLLKPLEEKKMVGMFCTTEPEKIRGPIRSRCEDYFIRKVTREDIAARMRRILEAENVAYEEDGILTVVDFSAGHVRDILNRLEMIAQVGPVTVEAVRRYLDLGVVSTVYKILLSLGDPATSVPMIEEVCDRVGADEASSRLAEAAMNSYRLAHGMHADFSIVDRELASQVYKMYGDAVVALASYFLQSYRPSKVGLVCDAVRYVSGMSGAAPQQTTPPVVFVTAPVAPAVSAVAPVVAPTVPAAAPVAAPAPVRPAAEEPSPMTPKSPSGIGALGSDDILALTELDPKGVKETHPRDSKRAEARRVVPPGGEGGAIRDIIPPAEWTQGLVEGLKRLGISVGNRV